MLEWFNNFWGAVTDWFTEHSDSWLDTGHYVGVTLLKAIVIIVIGFWLTSMIIRVMRRAMRRTKVDKGVAGFVCSLANYVLRFIVIISVIATLGINVTSVITALGAVGITIGLAMQDSLSNFASGVLILFNRPFRVGDYVEAEGVSGTVQRIELMYTSLLTPDNKEIVIPNSRLTSQKLLNYTAEPGRRMDMTFRVTLDEDVAKVKKCLTEACAESKYVDQSIAPVIGIAQFTADAIVFELRPWIDANQYWDAFYDMQELVLVKFRENNVRMPASRIEIIEK